MRFCLGISILLFHFISSAQGTLKINLQRVNDNKIKVSYFPEGDFKTQGIFFSELNRQNYFQLQNKRFISSPKAFDSDNNSIKVRNIQNEFLPASEVYYWEFELNQKKQSDHISLSTQNHFKENASFFINPSIFLPLHKNSRQNFTIAIRDHISFDSVKIHNFYFDNESELLDFAFGTSVDWIQIQDSLHSINCYQHLRNSKISNENIANISLQIINAFENYTDIDVPDNFEIHLISLNSREFRNNKLSKSAIYSNGVSIIFDNEMDVYKQKEHLISELMWQLFRYVSPLQAHDETMEVASLKHGEHSLHLWYYESLTRYLSIVCLSKSKLIKTPYLVSTFQEKMVNSLKDQNFSLIQLGTEFHDQESRFQINRNIKVYDIFENRGVITALFMDIILQQGTGANRSLIDKFLEIYNRHKTETFPEAAFVSEFAIGEGEDFKRVIEKYVLGIDALDYRNYFNLIDWQFFRKGEVHKTFIKGGHFTFFPEIQYYVCTKAGKNSVGLQKGDVILSINNDTQISQINLKEIIMPNRSFRNENRVKIEIFRKGRNMVLRGKAEYNKKVNHNIIIPLFNPLSNGYQLRKSIFY